MVERITTRTELTWDADLRFHAVSRNFTVLLDGRNEQGPSPMETLAMSLAGCMAIDLVDILRKGRHDLRGLRASFSGLRAPEAPKRFEEITLHYTIEGEVPPAAIDRAIELSREKYCSVWHSMRPDITLRVTYDIAERAGVAEDLRKT